MPLFEVKVSLRGYEIYTVEAETAGQAYDEWYNGTVMQSEVTEAEAYDVREVED